MQFALTSRPDHPTSRAIFGEAEIRAASTAWCFLAGRDAPPAGAVKDREGSGVDIDWLLARRCRSVGELNRGGALEAAARVELIGSRRPPAREIRQKVMGLIWFSNRCGRSPILRPLPQPSEMRRLWPPGR